MRIKKLFYNNRYLPLKNQKVVVAQAFRAFRRTGYGFIAGECKCMIPVFNEVIGAECLTG